MGAGGPGEGLLKTDVSVALKHTDAEVIPATLSLHNKCCLARHLLCLHVNMCVRGSWKQSSQISEQHVTVMF